MNNSNEIDMTLRHATLVALLAAAFGANSALAQSCPANGPSLTYPVTKKVDQTDNYHGTTVADPYRWLEDANSAETKEWVTAQNKVTQAYLAQIPQRAAIRERLTKLWNYERYSVPG
jgi:prolyl oligopeptidase